MTPSSDQYKSLKALIEQAAAEASDIGELVESKKWGQPSFTPKRAGVGSSVRIEQRSNGDAALMFICTTGLVDQFRDLYDGTLHLEGNRAIVLPRGELEHEDALKHCIQLALTHKLRKG